MVGVLDDSDRLRCHTLSFSLELSLEEVRDYIRVQASCIRSQFDVIEVGRIAVLEPSEVRLRQNGSDFSATFSTILQ